MNNLSSRPSVAAKQAVLPNLVPVRKTPSFKKIHNEFIRHPQQFPLGFRRVKAPKRTFMEPQPPSGDLGLRFVSKKYVAAGATVEVSIPLRGEVQTLRGTIVMVREITDGYDIGLWFATDDDAQRARLIEQICHLECALGTEPHEPLPATPRKRRAWVRFPPNFPELLAH